MPLLFWSLSQLRQCGRLERICRIYSFLWWSYLYLVYCVFTSTWSLAFIGVVFKIFLVCSAYTVMKCHHNFPTYFLADKTAKHVNDDWYFWFLIKSLRWYCSSIVDYTSTHQWLLCNSVDGIYKYLIHLSMKYTVRCLKGKNVLTDVRTEILETKWRFIDIAKYVSDKLCTHIWIFKLY